MNYPFEFEKYRRRNPPRCKVEGDIPENNSVQGFAVIPAMNESPDDFAAVLESLHSAGNSAQFSVIVVVNQPPDAPLAVTEANRTCLEWLRSRNFPHVCWIDRTSIPVTFGVGEARRAGMDAALFLLGPDAPEKRIHSLDADTLVSPDYFTAAGDFFVSHPRCGGGVYAFSHRDPASPEIADAIARYEAYIRNYAAMLRHAGSPYGYAAIGSAFAVRCDGYLKAGGMRRRTAGEDFYFLQALRKCAGIGEIPHAKVYPSARISGRTPFGTGQKLHDQVINGVAIVDFPEQSFRYLKLVLDQAENIHSDTEFLAALPEEIRPFFQDFPAIWATWSRHKSQDAFAFHRWFDALKTLQFIKFAAKING